MPKKEKMKIMKRNKAKLSREQTAALDCVCITPLPMVKSLNFDPTQSLSKSQGQGTGTDGEWDDVEGRGWSSCPGTGSPK